MSITSSVRAFGAVSRILLLVGGLITARAGADIVHLKNGNRVEGDVLPGSKPGSIKVVLDKGLELEFPDKDVREVESKKSPAREFDEKLAALGAGDADALLGLADWARERKLRSREEQVYRRVLEIDPDDPVARRELGYAVFKNRWVKESDLRSKHGLIQFRGDWVTPEEKERRIQAELKQEIADLLRGVESDNSYIREYSVRKLLEYRDPRARGVALFFLSDQREAVRAMAVKMLEVLGSTPAPAGKAPAAPTKGGAGGTRPAVAGKPAGEANGKAAGKAGPGPRPAGQPGPGEEEVSQALLARVLVEESPQVRGYLAGALRKLRPRRFFELALATLSSSANPLERDRAAEGILFALRKTWMGELIRALPRRPPGVGPTIGGNPAVHSILAKISREDFGYRTADWEAWWAKSQARFTDEE